MKQRAVNYKGRDSISVLLPGDSRQLDFHKFNDFLEHRREAPVASDHCFEKRGRF